MDIFKDLKTIYFGKFSFYRNISLFSLLGILFMAFNRYLSFITNNVFADFLGFVNANNIELFLYLFVSLLLFIFFIGYYFKFINNISNDVFDLPDFNLSCFEAFIKIIPLFFVWGIYFIILAMFALICIPITSWVFHVYFAILICSIPFINLIFVSFAKNFKFDKILLNPFLILVVLDKALGEVIYLTVKILIFSIIPAAFVYLLIFLSSKTNNVELHAILRTFALCFGGYFSYIISLLYAMGLAKISKNKLVLV